MYTCILDFGDKKTEISKLLDSNLIRCKSLEGNLATLKTRKLWKFYWFNYRFKKFERKFTFEKFFTNPNKNFEIPLFIRNHFDYNVSIYYAFTRIISVDFSNINDIWKIKLSFLFKI